MKRGFGPFFISKSPTTKYYYSSLVRSMFKTKFLRLVLSFSLFSLTLACSGSSIISLPPSDNDYVTLYGVVNETTATQVITRLEELQTNSDKPIYFFIDSPGGEVFQGTKIIDAMLASKRPIYTVDVGTAASMAAFIHSFGQKRYMLPHATLMFHNSSGGFSGDAAKVRSRMNYVSAVMEDLNKNVSSRSGISIQELENKENVEWWILANEANQRHLIDGIITIFPPSIDKTDK